MQKSLKESAYRLLCDKIEGFGLTDGDGFNILQTEIRTPGDGIIIFQGMQDHTAESIKSLEGFHRAWVEEAQTLSARSLELLRPTIRAKGSELWFTWNPRRKNDPVDAMFLHEAPTNSVCIKANWSDNPWFPDELEQERLDCLKNKPDQYEHIWEGDYITAMSGAYYAAAITKARAENRVGHVPADPLMNYKAFFDIGGTGAKSDACSVWIGQFIGKEIHMLDYYEAIGQPLATHVGWLQTNGYAPVNTNIYLPHDGVKHDSVYQVTYESELKRAGYSVTVVPRPRVSAVAVTCTRVRSDARPC